MVCHHVSHEIKGTDIPHTPTYPQAIHSLPSIYPQVTRVIHSMHYSYPQVSISYPQARPRYPQAGPQKSIELSTGTPRPSRGHPYGDNQARPRPRDLTHAYIKF